MLKRVLEKKEEIKEEMGLSEMEWLGLLRVSGGERNLKEVSEILYGERGRWKELRAKLDELESREEELLIKEVVGESRGRGDYEVMGKKEVEELLSEMGRSGSGMSGKDRLQAIGLYIRLKGWGGKEEEGEEGVGELVKMLNK